MMDDIPEPQDLGEGGFILSGEDGHLAELLGEFLVGDWARMMLLLDAETRSALRTAAAQYVVEAQLRREAKQE